MKTAPVRFCIAAVLALLCGSMIPAHAQDVKWLTNYAKAVEQAKAENKPILINITGSDWCPWCIKMKEETLDKPAFKEYAAKNLVLMEADFPNEKEQTFAVKKQNEQLKAKYKADGFPTFLLVDKDGNELGRVGGYMDGGPSAFIAQLDKFRASAPATPATTSAPAAGPAKGGSDFDTFFKKPQH